MTNQWLSPVRRQPHLFDERSAVHVDARTPSQSSTQGTTPPNPANTSD
ncbi:hypothetical protein HSB1_05050 [Halogranum salarium B-1]|uniref:Uncharacterized protein n=1 Tax=Halogranum salarium B-1 TaxID=1210908 RepID=J3JI09_9EURY|nr:hypothetical protein HSB1_05050 [Halogranum salarium B-1]